MTQFERFIITDGLIVVTLLAFIGIIKVTEDIFIDKGETLRLTQNSEFVVEKVRHDYEQWNYHFKLRNLNLEDDRKINTLIIETDKPMGYHRGDTLRLLHHGDYSE